MLSTYRMPSRLSSLMDYLKSSLITDCVACVECTVYHDGTLCMDIIQDAWSPCHNVATILTSIQVH